MTKPSFNQILQWRGSHFFEQNSFKSTTVKLKTNEWPQSRASTLFGWDRNNWNNISGFFSREERIKETFYFYLNWPPGDYLHLRLELNLSCLVKDNYVYRWTEHLADFLFKNSNWGRGKGPPNYTPGVDFLDHDLL